MEFPDEDQQQQKGQEGEHVEFGVHGWHQNHYLIVMAVVGGPIGHFNDLEEGKKKKEIGPQSQRWWLSCWKRLLTKGSVCE